MPEQGEPETVEVVIGVIGRPHGLRGEVAVELRTDEPNRRFAVGAVVDRADGGPSLTVRSVREHNGRFLIRFDELADRTAVEAARGARLTTWVDTAEKPEDDQEYYDRQLIGLRVVDNNGAEVGEVSDVIHLPAQDLLAIAAGENERLVPFVAALVPVIDLEHGLVRLADIPGLLSDQESS